MTRRRGEIWAGGCGYRTDIKTSVNRSESCVPGGRGVPTGVVLYDVHPQVLQHVAVHLLLPPLTSPLLARSIYVGTSWIQKKQKSNAIPPIISPHSVFI
jgi:hypothetical protein